MLVFGRKVPSEAENRNSDLNVDEGTVGLRSLEPLHMKLISIRKFCEE